MPSLRKSLVSLLLAAVAVSAQGGPHGHGRFSGRPSGVPSGSVTRIPEPHPTFVNGSQTGFPEPPRGPRNETDIPPPHFEPGNDTQTDIPKPRPTSEPSQLEARLTELEVASEGRPENGTQSHIPRPHPTSLDGSPTDLPEPPRGPRNETDIPPPHFGPGNDTQTDIPKPRPTSGPGPLEARLAELEVPSEPRPGNGTQSHIPRPHPTSLDGSPTDLPEPPRGPRNETDIPPPHFGPGNDTQTDIPKPRPTSGHAQLEARLSELELPSEGRPENGTQTHIPKPHPTGLNGSPTGLPEPPHGPRNGTHVPPPHFRPGNETQSRIPEPQPTDVNESQIRISEVEAPSESRNETHIPGPHFGPGRGNDTQTDIPLPPSGSLGAAPTHPPHTGTAKGPMPTPTITRTREMTTRPPWVGAGKRAATPTALTTTFPASAGSTTFPTAIKVSGSFDGKMMKYDRNTKVCQDQTETGEADAIFILADGATLSNVIIGSNQAEGVHCKGTCTLNNVWWLDVCEDAATFKQTSGTSYINGGGAKSASDKVFQHNGFGTVSIKNFYVDTFGKLYRSCGNCSNNGGARHVIMDNIYSKNGGLLAGINTNFGDTAKISNSCVPNNKICDRFQGTTTGEPTKIGSGPDGKYCVASNIKTSC